MFTIKIMNIYTHNLIQENRNVDSVCPAVIKILKLLIEKDPGGCQGDAASHEFHLYEYLALF